MPAHKAITKQYNSKLQGVDNTHGCVRKSRVNRDRNTVEAAIKDDRCWRKLHSMSDNFAK